MVKSIKDLKREVEEKYKFWLGEGENYSEVASEVFGILQLVNSFEASVRDVLDKIEYLENIPTTQKEDNLMRQARAEELRRILDGD